MTIDISKIKVGDKVTAEFIVQEISRFGGAWVQCKLTNTNSCALIDETMITVHTPAPPKPLEVGDMVSHRYGSSYGTLAYVSNDGKMGVVETPFGVILYDMTVLVRAE